MTEKDEESNDLYLHINWVLARFGSKAEIPCSVSSGGASGDGCGINGDNGQTDVDIQVEVQDVEPVRPGADSSGLGGAIQAGPGKPGSLKKASPRWNLDLHAGEPRRRSMLRGTQDQGREPLL